MATGDKATDDLVQSALSYGPVQDLAEMDVDKPAGEVADWDAIFKQLKIDSALLFKVAYTIAYRLPQVKKESKNTRVKFTDSKAAANADPGDKKQLIYISFPTDRTSVKKEELTAGRFKTITAAVTATVFRERKWIPPIMAVIGFKDLVENWSVLILEIATQFSAVKKKTDKANSLEELKREQTLTDDEEKWAIALFNARKFADGGAGRDLLNGLESATELPIVNIGPELGWQDSIALWALVMGTDRLPPYWSNHVMMMEIYCLFNLLQDVRNCITASIITGTSADKAKSRSEFFKSGLRRSQASGARLNQTLFTKLVAAVGPFCVSKFQVSSGLPEKVREIMQAEIDGVVKRMSSNTPERLV